MMRGSISAFMFNGLKRKTVVEVELDGNQCEELERLKDKAITADFKIFREKRSLNANALCWKLCTEIANIARADKDSIYLEMLKRYGQSEIVSVVSDIKVNGYFKYFEELGTGFVNGKEFTHYKVFKGSSEYDSREMAILLDGIVSEAKELGIPVMTERELSLIKSDWGVQP